MTYEIHPAAELFPLMEDDQFQALVVDIRDNGLQEPIVLFEGKIIDGRHRLRACEVLGIEPIFTNKYLIEDPVSFVLSHNLHRRHLTIAQRSAIAMDLLPTISEAAKERVRIVARQAKGERRLPAELEDERGGTAEALAEMFSVGRSSIEKTIAINKVQPEVIERMRSGEIRTVDAAMRAAGINKEKRPYLRAKRHDDAFYEVIPPMLKYLNHWAQTDHKHINPAEARRRLMRIQDMREQLDLLEDELSKRAVKARTHV